MARDEFSQPIRNLLAERVGWGCSICRKPTSGPNTDPQQVTRIGKAAHITAASPGGPRWDENITNEERSSAANGIWCCSDCATIIDRDVLLFPAKRLRQLKEEAEAAAFIAMSGLSPFRPIAPTEIVQGMSVGTLAAVAELSGDFRCHIETNVRIPTKEGGWVRFDAAAVRSADTTLIAFDIFELGSTATAIPYFQVEYLRELITKVQFDRFAQCLHYSVVVSDAPVERDKEVQERLQNILQTAPHAWVKLYRLKELRAKHRI